jgi:hypothetical protein
MAIHCPICGEKIKLKWSQKVVDGNICLYCATISSKVASESVEHIRNLWGENHRRFEIFTPTDEIKSSYSTSGMTVDEAHEYICFRDKKGIKKICKSKRDPIIFSFSEIVSLETEVVGQKVKAKKKGGVGRAIVGGAIAGPVGAIVGASTAATEETISDGTKFLIVHLNGFGESQKIRMFYNLYIENFVKQKITENGGDQNDLQPTNETISVADELLKFKSLLDSGVITEEEFDAQKKKLLGE